MMEKKLKGKNIFFLELKNIYKKHTEIPLEFTSVSN